MRNLIKADQKKDHEERVDLKKIPGLDVGPEEPQEKKRKKQAQIDKEPVEVEGQACLLSLLCSRPENPQTKEKSSDDKKAHEGEAPG